MNAGQITALVLGIVLTLTSTGCTIATISGMLEDLSGGWIILVGVLILLAGGIFLICLGCGVIN